MTSTAIAEHLQPWAQKSTLRVAQLLEVHDQDAMTLRRPSRLAIT